MLVYLSKVGEFVLSYSPLYPSAALTSRLSGMCSHVEVGFYTRLSSADSSRIFDFEELAGVVDIIMESFVVDLLRRGRREARLREGVE